MAKQKRSKKSQKTKRGGRKKAFLPLALLAILILGSGFGWMAGCAHITHLKYADVYLQDLPAEFDGARLLFISDVNIQSRLDSAASVRLMRKLQSLNPDLLLLGGDYGANSLLEILNGKKNAPADRAADFIRSLADFSAPLGKFAVAGDMDDAESLAPLFDQAGVQLLQDGCAFVERENAQLVIAGLNDASRKTTRYEQIGRYFQGDECVLVLAHNPSAYVGVRVAEAKGGGAWADLVLSGHTMGGQIRLGDHGLRSYADEQPWRFGGWYSTDDLPMLVSGGLGCQGAKLRLNTESEIWLLTLRCPQRFSLPNLAE